MTETTYEHSEGRIKVANEVIAHIAALTAMQVPGIAGVSDRSNQIVRVIRRGGLHKGVRVELASDDSLRLHMHLVAEAGRHLPTLAAEVQRNVSSAVERMLGLSTSAVNVMFADVRFHDAAH